MDPMSSQPDLHTLALKVGAQLRAAKKRIVTAESCTGGWVGKALTDVPGSSAWYSGGVIAYSNELKQRLLEVRGVTLVEHGAVSEAVALEMARGALDRLGGEVAVAVTGIAGPEGGQPGKPVGTVWFGWAWREESAVRTRSALETFRGDRDQVRHQSVARGLIEVLRLCA